VADRLRAEGVDCRRRGKDRRAREESGELRTELATYKISEAKYFCKQYRVFPFYLQTSKSYLIEKSKRKMIAEDLKTALEHHNLQSLSYQANAASNNINSSGIPC
jgi:hypothetical protein